MTKKRTGWQIIRAWFVLFFGICWWAWIPIVLGKWYADIDFPVWIRETVYTATGADHF